MVRRRAADAEKGYFSPAPPRVIAHRGLAVEAPENTLLAFLNAVTTGVTHLETDVHLSADGVAVIAHDPDLARVADRDVRVEQLTARELARVALGNGQGFPTLAEAIDAFPDARFNIDLKTPRVVEAAVEAIRATRSVDRVLVTSFDSARRRRAVDALPGVATSASRQELMAALPAAALGLTGRVRHALRGVHAVQMPMRIGKVDLLTPRSVAALRASGVELHVWTINEPQQMRRLFGMGVDGIVTDRADLALEVVREFSG